jgi:polar amino acid transport system permease protein
MRVQLDFMAVLAEWPLLLKGVAWTLALTAVAVIVGTRCWASPAPGRGLRLGRTLAPRWLQAWWVAMWS